MHIKPHFIIIIPLVIPSVVSAPIYEDSRQDLTARGVIPAPGHAAIPNSGLTPLASNSPAPNNQLRIAAFSGNTASHLNKLKLTTQFAPGFQKASTSLPNAGAFCPATRKGSSIVCGSGPHYEGSQLNLHPEGKNGPDTSTSTKLKLGKVIGRGNRGVVYDVTHHTLGDHDLAAKVYHPWQDANPVEVSRLRQLGQLHASGKCDGRDCIVMKKAKGVGLTETEAYKSAEKKGPIAMAQTVTRANDLAGDARFKHMHKDRLLHTSVSDHVKYEVDENGKPVKANLVGWGNAREAPKRGPEELYHPDLEEHVRHLHDIEYPFDHPPNKRIGSHPTLPRRPGWDDPAR